MQRFDVSPSTSTQSVAAELGFRHKMVWKVLRVENMDPSNVQKVELLSDDVYPLRERDLRCLLGATQNDSHSPATVLISDETCFTREGVINTHNSHMWWSENPHSTFSSKWNTGRKYLAFLQHVLPKLLQGIPPTVRQNKWFRHDGAPARFCHCGV